MDEQDRILKRFVKSRAFPEDAAQGKDCLSEEGFAEYIEGLLDPEQKQAVEKHFDLCEACSQKSIMLSSVISSIKENSGLDVPGEVTERAKALVRAQNPKDIIEVILEFGKDIINVIKDTAGICTVPEPAVLCVRDGDGAKEAVVAKLSKTFNEIKADISIERTDEGECEVHVRMTDAVSGKAGDDIRVSLVAGEKELASYLTVEGCASFKALMIDTYTLKFHKGKDHIGSVLLNMSSAV